LKKKEEEGGAAKAKVYLLGDENQNEFGIKKKKANPVSLDLFSSGPIFLPLCHEQAAIDSTQ